MANATAETGSAASGPLSGMTILRFAHAFDTGGGVHYQSVPEHPYYQQTFGWKPGDYPFALKAGRQTVSLPLSAKLTDQDVDDVILAVRRLVGKN
jgi:dTDP-4-amino-4,6-dideoxygalactose transaminase